MTRKELLLQHCIEEALELGHRTSKALRFSLDETQPGHDQTNRERCLAEFYDLCAVLELAGLIRLQGVGNYGSYTLIVPGEAIDDKRAKVEEYLERSRAFGVLTD